MRPAGFHVKIASGDGLPGFGRLRAKHMNTVQQYLRHAAECDALARKATSQEQREMILGMAQTWRMLAAQRQRKLEKSEPSVDLK